MIHGKSRYVQLMRKEKILGFANTTMDAKKQAENVKKA